MADASLEDFFAKKDKKKNKGAKKFTTTGEIARKLEETDKKLEKASKVQLLQLRKSDKILPDDGDCIESTQKIENVPKEDEWREFEEEREKDYSDLKIQKLQIDEDEDKEDNEEAELDEDGEPVKHKDGSSGPWNKNSTTSQNTQGVQEAPKSPPPEPVPETPKQTGGYVPPHRRGLAASATSSTGYRSGGRHKVIPDISSEVMFPSLDAGSIPEPTGAWGRRQQVQEQGFESVKHGSTPSQDMQAGPKLNLGNKFDALRMSENS